MIYNFNQGIGWASSGVEYAQAYRASVLRRLGEPMKFIFTDEMPYENIERLTQNLGFHDDEILWLYQFFTTCRIAPSSYPLSVLKEGVGDSVVRTEKKRNVVTWFLEGEGNYAQVFLIPGTDLVHRVEHVIRGKLVRKDYYTYCRIYSEFYAPKEGKAVRYLRRFYHEDGTMAYDEISEESKDSASVFRFPDRVLYSKEELVGLLFERLGLGEEDIVLIDRNERFGQAILQNVGRARVGVVIHAEHFSEGSTDASNILWNNYYEYAFAMHRHIDFYICATREQKQLLEKQFLHYLGEEILAFDIPVGALPALRQPGNKRVPHSMITASRLATEKHLNWLIRATAIARKVLPDLTLDIYGEGGQRNALQKQIEEEGLLCCVRLMGQQKLDEIYQRYAAYVAASTSEGFGLTLMEAVGAGLPMIGFDVRYGNKTFIDEGKNGYLIPYEEGASDEERAESLAEYIVRLFTDPELPTFYEHSYQIASRYTEEQVEMKWNNALKRIRES